MKVAAVVSGAAVPRRISELLSGRPAELVCTLGQYEAVEATLLSGRPEGAGPGAIPAPALLLSPRAWRALGPGRSIREVLNDARLVVPPYSVTGAGVCHEFIDYYGEPREDVLPLLPSGCRDVLEIGCGRGVTGKLVQDRLGCRVTGVELNPVVARAASEVLHRVIPGDVMNVDLPDGFDALVALELFEHLTDQEAFLEKARHLVRPGGRIVLSVPNVGHYSIVEDLLKGRWDYLPIGLLCYTHYRFFTRRTLEEWLLRCRFRKFDLIPQETELPERFRSLGLTCDEASLRATGFHVLIENS
jgi:SAM-dependent methyltransferase